MAATEPIRDKKQLKALADYFLKRGQLRNYTLIIMGMSAALRISDLLRLRWPDVYDELHNTFRTHIAIIETKTKKTKTIALNKQVLQALRLYFPHRRGDFIFCEQPQGGQSYQPGTGMADHPCGGSGGRRGGQDLLSQSAEDLGLSRLDEQRGLAGSHHAYL